MSCGFAAAPILRAWDHLQILRCRHSPAVLLVVFAVRLAKTKKFMPAGLMVAATVVTLAFCGTSGLNRPAPGNAFNRTPGSQRSSSPRLAFNST